MPKRLVLSLQISVTWTADHMEHAAGDVQHNGRRSYRAGTVARAASLRAIPFGLCAQVRLEYFRKVKASVPIIIKPDFAQSRSVPSSPRHHTLSLSLL